MTRSVNGVWFPLHLLCFLITTTCISALPVAAQDDFDLGDLLRQAEQIESPLSEPYVCPEANRLLEPLDGANAIISLRVE
ncbi:MAG: hypothetical protein KKF33_04605, partial [Alphaproteobacteria bacterium]|nr:hypothetical protein [Alphaproteobacteria bacterium]